MYVCMNWALDKLKKDTITFIIGEFNAKSGQGRKLDLVSDYELGESNAAPYFFNF